MSGRDLHVYADARGLEARVWRGWQVYAFEALRALAMADSSMVLHVQIRGVEVPQHLDSLARLPNMQVVAVAGRRWSHLRVPLRVLRTRSAVYWRLFNEFRPIYVPTCAKNVVTIHDLQRVVIDEQGRPHVTPCVPGNWRWARRQIDHIITVSETTRRQVVEHLGWDERRISVVPNGFADSETSVSRPPSIQPRERFILAVNLGNYYKNSEQVLESFRHAIARPEMADVRLVVAGSLHAQASQVEAYLQAHPHLAERVCLLGQVGDAELRYLYAACLGLLALSRYEGFGRTLVEAAAYGAPVVASDIEAHREVGGPQTIFVPLDDVNATVRALHELVAHAGSSDVRPFVGFPTRYRWAAVAQGLSHCLRSMAGVS